MHKFVRKDMYTHMYVVSIYMHVCTFYVRTNLDEFTFMTWKYCCTCSQMHGYMSLRYIRCDIPPNTYGISRK